MSLRGRPAPRGEQARLCHQWGRTHVERGGGSGGRSGRHQRTGVLNCARSFRRRRAADRSGGLHPRAEERRMAGTGADSFRVGRTPLVRHGFVRRRLHEQLPSAETGPQLVHDLPGQQAAHVHRGFRQPRKRKLTAKSVAGNGYWRRGDGTQRECGSARGGAPAVPGPGPFRIPAAFNQPG